MAMNYPWAKSSSEHSSSSRGQDILIKRILLTHDPARQDLDSEMLLRVIEAIMHHATPSQGSVQPDDVDGSGIDIDVALQPTGNSVYKTTCEILCRAYTEKNEDASTLSALNLLGHYRWQDKMLLALSAFVTVYGKFWIIVHYRNQNSLAASIAILQQFPKNIDKFKPVFMALAALVKTMVEAIKCVADFGRLPIANVELQDEMVTATKSLIYLATYWVVRSTMVCISLFTNRRDIRDEQVHGLSLQLCSTLDPCSTSAVVWEITSLQIEISSIRTKLRTQVDACQQQTDQQMYMKLVKLFQETHTDNQEVLHMLFALKNDSPLKQNSTQTKVGISFLKNKVVILLISKPELLPVEDLLFLVHQTYDHPLHNKLEGKYDIVWLPISSGKWTNNEIKIFTFLSNSLPWYSIRQPWSISSTTINYAKQEWGHEAEPVMVVLDSNGRVTNLNASDMVRIWGATAYPFSDTREKELWNEGKWSLKFLLNNINPLFTMWVEEGKAICICGSSNLEWIREFCAMIKDVQSLVPQLEVIYVGSKDPSHLVTNIVSLIESKKLSNSLSLTKIHFFWRRLDSMRRSKVRLGETTDTDHVLREVEALLHNNEVGHENWMIIGRGPSTNIIKLGANEWMKFLGQYPVWRKYLPSIELVDAIRLFLEPPQTEPCSDSRIISYNEGMMEEKVLCEICKHPMEKFIVYDAVQ